MDQNNRKLHALKSLSKILQIRKIYQVHCKSFTRSSQISNIIIIFQTQIYQISRLIIISFSTQGLLNSFLLSMHRNYYNKSHFMRNQIDLHHNKSKRNSCAYTKYALFLCAIDSKQNEHKQGKLRTRFVCKIVVVVFFLFIFKNSRTCYTRFRFTLLTGFLFA